MDISRDAFDRRKHWDGLRVHQGSVATDDDFNEADVITKEDRRRERVDVIGPAGSPDQGFQVGAPRLTPDGHLDFDLGRGSMYVGGLRCEVDSKETYLTQRDWLEQPRDEISPLVEVLPIAPSPAAERYDLAYLEVWQQPVSAVEDAELFEVALGGADTSSRVRTMRRVRVLVGAPGATATCDTAWQTLVGALGTLGHDNQLVTDAKLTVSPDDNVPPDSLCTPAVTAGYLGAENQAIRVQLVDAKTLTWGYDNASPVYRVQLSAITTTAAGTTTATVSMLTPPRDEVHWPITNQVVELLGWSAVLPNNEKVAEAVGLLATAATPYDPTTTSFSITLPATAGLAAFGLGWTGWNTRAGANLGATDPIAKTAATAIYVYMRVWNRGADVMSPAAIPFTANTAVALTGTGLQVTLTGTTFRPGDFWVIAARPDSPQLVVPWQLQNTGRQPNGLRRFYAPLGLIHWQADGKIDTSSHDCRATFPPLTQRRGCCTYTVGDGGDYPTIQAAVLALPTDGGEVCVLPGTYTENVFVQARKHVVIHGCGARSRLVAPDAAGAAIQIIHSTGITIRDLAIDATTGPGILIGVSPDNESDLGTNLGTYDDFVMEWPPLDAGVDLIEKRNLLSRDIVLRDLHMTTRDRAAIFGRNVTNARIEDVAIVVEPLTAPVKIGTGTDTDLPGTWPAIYLGGSELVIEGCRVVLAAGAPTGEQAAGGIQIVGGSAHVRIDRCVIRGGTGNGITLGSVTWSSNAKIGVVNWSNYIKTLFYVPSYFGGVTMTNGCVMVNPWPQPPTGPTGPLTPVPDDPIRDIRIVGNDISEMGRSGIGVPQFFEIDDDDGEAIQLARVLIADNRIVDCLALEQVTTADINLEIGLGGISLAVVAGLEIRHNEIRGNGRRHAQAACGVFAQATAGLIIADNRILDNGPGSDSVPNRSLQCGGILIGYAVQSFDDVLDLDLDVGGGPFTNEAAARIFDNFVSSPCGAALELEALGPVMVTGNQLVALGGLPRSAEGLAVTIVNIGWPADWAILRQDPGEVIKPSPIRVDTGLFLRPEAAKAPTGKAMPKGTADQFDVGIVEGPAQSALGDTLFNNNQVQLLLSSKTEEIASAVHIAVVADLSFQNNQIVSFPMSAMTYGANLIAGRSIRVEGNNFEDSAHLEWSARTHAGFLLTSNRLLNTTTLNHSTHCITTSIVGPGRLYAANNFAVTSDECDDNYNNGK